jgi:hypothetical protein
MGVGYFLTLLKLNKIRLGPSLGHPLASFFTVRIAKDSYSTLHVPFQGMVRSWLLRNRTVHPQITPLFNIRLWQHGRPTRIPGPGLANLLSAR